MKPTLPTEQKHIVLDHRGVPYIEGTTMKVRELIVEHQAHGWSADELIWQHPYLTLADDLQLIAEVMEPYQIANGFQRIPL